MTDFVLLHDAAHGAWCWRPLSAELGRRGHRGLAFDLPGHGRDHTPRVRVDYAAYLAAAERAIAHQRLRGAVLVGHGLAGILVPEVVARCPGVFKRVVFLAALVSEPGERAIDLLPRPQQRWLLSAAAASSECTIAIDYVAARARLFNDLDSVSARRWFRKLTPQPLAPYLAPAHCSVHNLPLACEYWLCIRDRTLVPALAQRCAARLGTVPRIFDAAHDAMLSRPAQLAAALAALCP